MKGIKKEIVAKEAIYFLHAFHIQKPAFIPPPFSSSFTVHNNMHTYKPFTNSS